MPSPIRVYQPAEEMEQERPADGGEILPGRKRIDDVLGKPGRKVRSDAPPVEGVFNRHAELGVGKSIGLHPIGKSYCIGACGRERHHNC